MARIHPHSRAARGAAVGMLVVMAALVAVWAAPRVSAAAAAWVGTPPVRSASLGVPTPLVVAAGPREETGGGAPAVEAGATTRTLAPSEGAASSRLDAGMRFTMLGVTCRPPGRRGAVTVYLRTSEDGREWSRWYSVALERAAEQGGVQQAFTEPIWTGAGRFVEIAATGGRGAPVSLRDVEVVAINSTEDADRAAVVLGVLRRAAAAVAGIDPASPAGAMTTKPRIVSRAKWGANESWRRGSPSYAPVKMAFIHHTASGNSYSASQAPAIVRGVYHYHTRALHWSDVAYNFLVDRYGVIYEGRRGGVARGVIGAHTLGYNTGSTGISVIGTYSSVTPSSAAVTSLERLLEWKLDVHHVDPRGTATLVCGAREKYKAGQRVKLPAIAGHRDANYTDCPGNRFQAMLPTIRAVVGRKGHPKIYGFVIEHPAISPDGDGVLERTSLGFTVSRTASWRLEVRDAGGGTVWRVAGDGTLADVVWDGRDAGGRRLPDGRYTVVATATGASGTARPATGVVRLDTQPPAVESVRVSPDPFSPNNDGHTDRTTLRFEPSESAAARVSVVSASGAVLCRLTSWQSVSARAQRVTWDGRISDGGALVAAPEGSATLALEVRDAARNTTTLRREVVVDRTLRFVSLSRDTFSPNGDGRHDTVTLGYRLAHPAQVTGSVVRAGRRVATLPVGALPAGSGGVVWDGALDDGGSATSGAYRLVVTAAGAVGTSTVAEAVTVDLTRPRIAAPASAGAASGGRARVSYRVYDAFSPKVRVTVAVVDRRGRAVATVSCGWVKQGVRRVWVWKPPRRGAYTLTFTARDRGGNPQVAPVTTALRVR